MKTMRTAVFMALALSTILAAGETDAQKSFEKLKALDGTWEGKTSDGRSVRVSFRTTSNGSALMSEIMGDENMITMIHLDGDRLLLTHYCGAGNQPRMKATTSPDGKTITFDFVDATNLANPQAGHMQRVTFSIPDTNHHSEEWIFLQNGKEARERFDLQRQKPM
jgi:hypothetical protein